MWTYDSTTAHCDSFNQTTTDCKLGSNSSSKSRQLVRSIVIVGNSQPTSTSAPGATAQKAPRVLKVCHSRSVVVVHPSRRVCLCSGISRGGDLATATVTIISIQSPVCDDGLCGIELHVVYRSRGLCICKKPEKEDNCDLKWSAVKLQWEEEVIRDL